MPVFSVSIIPIQQTVKKYIKSACLQARKTSCRDSRHPMNCGTVSFPTATHGTMRSTVFRMRMLAARSQCAIIRKLPLIIRWKSSQKESKEFCLHLPPVQGRRSSLFKSHGNCIMRVGILHATADAGRVSFSWLTGISLQDRRLMIFPHFLKMPLRV